MQKDILCFLWSLRIQIEHLCLNHNFSCIIFLHSKIHM